MASRLLFLLLLALSVFIADAAAQEDRDALIRQATGALEDIRADIERDRIIDQAAIEAEIRAYRDASRDRLDPVRAEIARAEADSATLGPPPKTDEPPETESLRAQRAALNERLARLRSQEIQITANIAQATELLARLSAMRVRTIYDRVLSRGPSLIAPPLWREGAAAGAGVGGKVAVYFGAWRAEKERTGGLGLALAIIAASLALLVLLFGPVNRWISRSFSSRVEKYEPSPSRRIVVAGLKMLAQAGPGIVGGLGVFEALRIQGLIVGNGEDVARAAWFGLVAILLVNGFVSGLFAARNPKWRIAPMRAEQGRRAGAYVVAIVSIFSIKTVIAEIAATAGASPAIDRLIDGSSAVAIGVLLFLLCAGSLWRQEPKEAPDRAEPPRDQKGQPADENGFAWRTIRRLGRLVAVLTIAAPLAGYIDFADFVTSRLYFLAIILAVAWFLRALLREAAAWSERRLRGAQAPDKATTGADLFWIHATIDIIFILALAPAGLILAGFHWSFVRDFVVEAFLGLRIGGVELPSLASIFIAIGVFIGGLALTRLVQRGLEHGPFKHSRIDPGVQDSLTTLIGYGGLVLSLLAGVIALGVNLANLALIAGALSVGIGFGLQSIVNNFVSGLILLFERPIKVGDWVVTASGEGTVKKISVRSTEIETFDRASIIVPNSELISQTVTNWTHKNKIGRVAVAVGVSYGSDPEKVREVLLKCARDHPLVVRYPEPFVVWKDFGASSLDFEIRCYLRDISEGLGVRTDLRFAIFKAFKEAGIEIPFPQSDLHIKSLPDERSARKAAPKQTKRGDTAPAPPPHEPELAGDD